MSNIENEIAAVLPTFDFSLCDWFPVGGSLEASLLGFRKESAAGVYQLLAVRPVRKQDGTSVKLYWAGNGALFSYNWEKSVVGHYADKKAVASVTR